MVVKTWLARKLTLRVAKSVLENPKARAKIVSTTKLIWQSPVVRAKSAALLRRIRSRAGEKPDKNQTRLF